MRLGGLVRDKNGCPKIDDPENLPVQIKRMLTLKDRELMGDEMCRRLKITTASEEKAKNGDPDNRVA